MSRMFVSLRPKSRNLPAATIGQRVILTMLPPSSSNLAHAAALKHPAKVSKCAIST